MKILVVTNHRRNRSPGQRFRIEQYIQYLVDSDCHVDFSFYLSEKDDLYFYKRGKYFRKLIILLKSVFHRLADLRKARNYDIVFVYREAIMLGSVFFEKRLAKRAKLVFDFDDSIWLNDVSEGNAKLRWLKKPSKIKKTLGYADMIFAGNEYLAEYARKYNSNVKVVPTTIDTIYHSRKLRKNESEKPVCIGWTGTSTTLKHFEIAVPILEKIKEKYGDSVCFRVIANQEYENNDLKVKTLQWNLETEITDLERFDIGIMPLPDDEWSNGKCGFKGLQYMALEIPTIMSAVGVNKEIIEDGENGFLAQNEDEWFEKLSTLIESEELRQKIGKAGRTRVEESYSFNTWKEYYLKYFNELTNNGQSEK